MKKRSDRNFWRLTGSPSWSSNFQFYQNYGKYDEKTYIFQKIEKDPKIPIKIGGAYFFLEMSSRLIVANLVDRNFRGPPNRHDKNHRNSRFFKKFQKYGKKLKMCPSPKSPQKVPACRKWSFLPKYDQPDLVPTRI